MLARFSAFTIWALVAASALFWGLRLFVQSPAAPSYTVAVDDGAVVRGDLTRLFGSAPVAVAGPSAVAPELSSRFKLLGIMAPRANAVDRQGVALIAVDGKPARAFTVGTSLDDQLVLQSVSLRSAALGPARGQSAMVLEMPPLPSAATGTFPVLGGAPVPPARYVPPTSFPTQTLQAVPVQGSPAPLMMLPGQRVMPPAQGPLGPNQQAPVD